MKLNSRQKGARGEREFSTFLKEHGIASRRTQQFCGSGGDSADVITDIEKVHFEVKRVETLRIYDAVMQAQADKKEGKIPVVAHKKNRGEWLAIMPMYDLLRVLKQAGLIDSENPLLNLH